MTEPLRSLSDNITWWVPRVGTEEKDLVCRVLASHYLNEGRWTAELEDQLAALLGCKYVVTTTSGTSALFLILAALGIGAGDEVLVPDVTFIATANAVTLCGAKPVLVDVDPKTLTMDVARAEESISPRTKAVIPVHVSGRGCDMTAISAMGKKYNVHVIEDAAEALTSKQRGKTLGTWGIAGMVSFSPTKTITTGQGGAVLTDDEQLHQRLRALKDQGRPRRGTGGADRHDAVGFNFKLTNLQAAVGLGQLKRLDERLARMKRRHRVYQRHLGDTPGVDLFPFDLERDEIPQWTDALFDHRDELHAFLLSRQIDCRKFWYPLHRQRPYRRDDKDFPVSSRLSSRAMWLPSAPHLKDQDIEYVCRTIKEFYAR